MLPFDSVVHVSTHNQLEEPGMVDCLAYPDEQKQ